MVGKMLCEAALLLLRIALMRLIVATILVAAVGCSLPSSEAEHVDAPDNVSDAWTEQDAADEEECIMRLPDDRNTDYVPGLPVKAVDINALQDAVKFHAHGVVELPLVLSTRQVLTGTWTVQSTGLLTESAKTSVIRIPVPVPVGSIITGLRVRGIQASSGNQFEARLQGVTDDGTIADIGTATTSDNTITGTAQDVAVTLGASAETAGANRRYFVRVETLGGGGGLRTITGAFVSYKRPL
jgi:hypothetical protein